MTTVWLSGREIVRLGDWILTVSRDLRARDLLAMRSAQPTTPISALPALILRAIESLSEVVHPMRYQRTQHSNHIQTIYNLHIPLRELHYGTGSGSSAGTTFVGVIYVHSRHSGTDNTQRITS